MFNKLNILLDNKNTVPEKPFEKSEVEDIFIYLVEATRVRDIPEHEAYYTGLILLSVILIQRLLIQNKNFSVFFSYMSGRKDIDSDIKNKIYEYIKPLEPYLDTGEMVIKQPISE